MNDEESRSYAYEFRAYACVTCNATGLYDDDTCPHCSGTGIDNQN